MENKLPQMGAIAQLITAIDERNIKDYWAGKFKELNTIIEPDERAYK